MSIQAKIDQITKAAGNLDHLIKGMEGLRESLIPRTELETIVHTTIGPVLFDTSQQLHDTVDRCRQEIGEAVQVVQSIEARLRADIEEMKAQLAELREDLSGIIDAVSSKKRRTR
jgi:uncharacterized protein YdcH (DUF465 family)